jgi:hypothetical protein
VWLVFWCIVVQFAWTIWHEKYFRMIGSSHMTGLNFLVNGVIFTYILNRVGRP